jgi:hypothetical protein
MSAGVGAVDTTKTTDHYDLDDGDATTPIYLDYIVPTGMSGIIKVTLSWKRRPFRSTTNLTPSSIGTDATGSSGHSHNHGHTIPVDAGPFANAVGQNAAGGNFASGFGPTTAPVNSNAQGESGHSHSHTHTLSGSGAQAVTEGPIATVTAISFDGIDRTAALGGPWSGDVAELDITSVFLRSAATWHTIAFSLSGLGRLVNLLRIYYTTS